MTASVRIESEAWSDLRFAALARACGLADLEHALIRVAKIWSWQTEHYTPDAPTYVVDGGLIDAVLGDSGAVNLVRAKLAEEVPEGFRIRGGVGRIEWLWRLRRNSAAGGEATKRTSKLAIHTASLQASDCNDDNKTGPRGLAKRPSQEAGRLPSPLSLSLSPTLPDQISKPLSHAGAREALSPAQANRVKLRADAWDIARAEHDRLRGEGIGANARAWWAMPTGDAGKLLVAVTDELLATRSESETLEVVRQRTAVAVAEAVKRGDLDWFTPTRFWKQFWSGAENTPDSAAPRSRAGPRARGSAIGAASPRHDHPESRELKNFGDMLT